VLVWFIVALPALLTLLCIILEVANLYLARTELHNALESAAQAAVKDWAENFGMTGGDTLNARVVGNNYALANTINGEPVNLAAIDPALNYDAGEACNQNACGGGVFVFGAITDENPDFTFDCCQTPNCGAAIVQLDSTGQGSLSSNSNWGISFQPIATPFPDLRILRVVYRLPDMGQARVGAGNSLQTVAPRFDLSTEPGVSDVVFDNDTNAVLQDNCPNGQGGPSAQADVHGIEGSQVQFYYDVDPMDPCGSGTLVAGPVGVVSRSLAIEFPNNNADPQERFDITDRIRFGALVTDTIGNGQLDADAVGSVMTEITICYTDGISTFSCTGVFADTTHRSNECAQCAGLASWGVNVQPPPGSSTNQGLIIHPTGIPDIPCAPGSSANNNGQALGNVTLGNCFGPGGGSGLAFAVRAQATYPVPSIAQELFGLPIGPFTVTARADALLDCSVPGPQLYHLKPQNVLCNVNCP
jgi:hypothetical protein